MSGAVLRDVVTAENWGAHAPRVLVGKPGRSFTRVTAAASRNELWFLFLFADALRPDSHRFKTTG